MSDAVSTLVSTMFSTAVASLVAWLISGSDKAEARRNIIDHVTRIIELSMEYPFVEDKDICEQWPNATMSKDDKLRYEAYCCHVFNTMAQVWEFHNANRQKIRAMLHMEELAWNHRCWWENDPENKKGYVVGFRNFIDSTIANKKREKAK